MHCALPFEEAVTVAPDEGEALKELSMSLLRKLDYPQTIVYACKLDALGAALNNTEYQLYAAICMGQAMLILDRQDSAKMYLDKSLELAAERRDDQALCSIYNGLGLYASNVEMDYYGTIAHFFKGIEIARRSSNEYIYTVLLVNLGGIYYLKKDPVGLKYSLECYRLGHTKQEPFLIYSGATNTAYMYYLLQDYGTALRYLKEAEFIMEQNGFFNQSEIYNLFGNILSADGKEEQAAFYFDKALQFRDQAQPSAVINANLSYAQLLIKQKRYDEALPYLHECVALSNSRKSAIYRQETLRLLSLVHENRQDFGRTLSYYKEYHYQSDSIFNADKERVLSELRVKYDLESHENQMQRQQLALVQKKKQLQAVIFILASLLFTAAVLFVEYRRKNKLYLKIVKQNRGAMARQTALQKKIAELTAGGSEEPVKYSLSSLSDEKSRNLFLQLEKLMHVDKIYREKYLTKERLAEMFHTNRTYLSQVINQHTGHKFTTYINTHRIDEAIRILSDPENDIPLKALSSDLGFNSINTFYTSFRSVVGMTPSIYREKAIRLHQNNR
ncbi:MAG: helix-turn-helix domain-containing protein [Rikenellaceae bacterium]|nr:helix-turn-helix domain-containing protein [Rikenellaceae bacterium]